MNINRNWKCTFALLILFVAVALAPLSAEKIMAGEVLLHPESIALGDIGAGKLQKRMAILTYADSDRKSWSAEVNNGWLYKSGKPLTGFIAHGQPLTLKVSMKSSLAPAGEDANHHGLYTVFLNLEADNQHVSYQKKMASGNHREGIALNVGGEIRILELSFHVIEYPLEPVLTVSPTRLDFGALGQGQQLIKKIEITNQGRQALKWRIKQKIQVNEVGGIDAHPGAKWIKIFPELGVTTREIDYLHVSVDTTRLPPGIYGYVFSIESNGGEAAIELHAEISLETGLKILDVYRYTFGNDVLLSTNPQGETKTSYFKNYRKEGIAFRLFSPGTPGTIEFYRWYNPGKQLHFYSYEANGGGKLSREYLLEGAIGNIATSRLPNTRELYRWHQPSTGQYFFSTNQRGEGIQKKGYKYDGIAGFVR